MEDPTFQILPNLKNRHKIFKHAHFQLLQIFKMADNNKPQETPSETMRKKSENDTKPAQSHDEDNESVEEQPLDIGEHYLVRRSDDTWRE